MFVCREVMKADAPVLRKFHKDMIDASHVL